MSLLKSLEYEKTDFEWYSSQQFATVVFENGQTTVLRDGLVDEFKYDGEYNPSRDRNSSCVYVKEEWEDGKVVKICTIQHKGLTMIEIHSVDKKEMDFIFRESPARTIKLKETELTSKHMDLVLAVEGLDLEEIEPLKLEVEKLVKELAALKEDQGVKDV